jgi:hypothetical protein
MHHFINKKLNRIQSAPERSVFRLPAKARADIVDNIELVEILLSKAIKPTDFAFGRWQAGF